MSRSSLLFFCASIATMFLLYFFYALGAASYESVDVKKVFTIQYGEGLSSVTDRLLSEGIIRSRNGFLAYSVIAGALKNIKAGEYELSQGMGVPEIVRLFISGPPDELFVVKEGETVRDIDAALALRGIVKKGEFYSAAQYLEGFLFPDTYRFSKKLTIGDIVDRFIANFNRRTGASISEETIIALARSRNREALVASGSVSRADANLFRLMTIASMLEKEAASFDDRAVIAGLIEKRLKAGIALQIDATIVYLKCKGTFYNCPPLTRSDFSITSPYNTYQNPGLPKGPIGNPGLLSIEAAKNPVTSAYLYYLSDPATGRIIFSQTFEAHNDARAKYLGI